MVSLLWSCRSSSEILDTGPLPDRVICTCLLPLCGLALSFVGCFFCCVEPAHLGEVPAILFFALVSLAFVADVISTKLLWPSSRRVLLPLSCPRILMDSCLAKLRSFIHFEFILVYGVRGMVQFHSSAWGCPVFPAAFIEETVFSFSPCMVFPAWLNISCP